MRVEYTDERLKNLLTIDSERPELVGRGEHKTVNEAVSFDIETSSFYHDKKKCATMYLWAFDIKGVTFYGRTWKEFVSLINIVSKCYKLKQNKALLRCYVHNLSYEFQFMHKWFKWRRVFATKSRTVLFCITDNNIEFRCSYLLYGGKLETLSKELSERMENSESIEKLKMDYSLLRHSKTPLPPAIIDYVVRDVKIVTKYINNCIKQEGDISKIPLTKTGYVRRLCRERCMNNSDYRQMIHAMNLCGYSEYEVAKKAFAGGFTHSNPTHTREINYNVSSYDFSSSYPAVMISEKFPMSTGVHLTHLTEKRFEELMNNECCICTIFISNIRAKTLNEFYISQSKCRHIEGDFNKQGIESKYESWREYNDGFYPLSISNGRIYSARKLAITITSIDYTVLSEVYDFKVERVADFYHYEQHYLPKEIILTILDLYEAKTMLKGIVGKEEEYLISKQMLNSLYGMCVTDILRNEYKYDSERSEWEEPLLLSKLPPEQKDTKIEKENNKKGRFLFYLWGCFVTAYARRNLFLGITECGNDYIYSDTDSIKILHHEKYKDFISRYNTFITSKIDTVLSYYSIDVSRSRPKGKQMGIWDYEGTYTAFKTLGAKRYIYFDSHFALHITIAGLSKTAGANYLISEYLSTLPQTKTIYSERSETTPNDANDAKHNPFINYICSRFTDDLKIPAGHTGKLTHTYIDEEIHFTITDYLGNPCEIHELSYIHLEDVEYNLTLSQSFKTFLQRFILTQV